MLKFGAPFDKENELQLFYSGHDEHWVYLDNIDLSARFKIFKAVNLFKAYSLTQVFPDEGYYTFRNYGQMKNFTWKHKKYIVTTKSHLEYIRNSRALSVDMVEAEIKKGRVYILTLENWHGNMYGKSYIITDGALLLARLGIWETAILTGIGMMEDVSDIQRFLDIINEAYVIGLYAFISMGGKAAWADIIFHVDDNTKIFLDKLITIYRKDGVMRRYLGEHKITLGMVLDNLDLYHCLSFGF